MNPNVSALAILGLIAFALNACAWDVNGYRHKGGKDSGTYRCMGACP